MELLGSFVAQLLPFFPQTGVKHCLCSRRDQVLLSLENPHATGLLTRRGACAQRLATVIMARSGAARKIVYIYNFEYIVAVVLQGSYYEINRYYSQY